jgi:hypothetical protein
MNLWYSLAFLPISLEIMNRNTVCLQERIELPCICAKIRCEGWKSWFLAVFWANPAALRPKPPFKPSQGGSGCTVENPIEILLDLGR